MHLDCLTHSSDTRANSITTIQADSQRIAPPVNSMAAPRLERGPALRSVHWFERRWRSKPALNLALGLRVCECLIGLDDFCHDTRTLYLWRAPGYAGFQGDKAVRVNASKSKLRLENIGFAHNRERDTDVGVKRDHPSRASRTTIAWVLKRFLTLYLCRRMLPVLLKSRPFNTLTVSVEVMSCSCCDNGDKDDVGVDSHSVGGFVPPPVEITLAHDRQETCVLGLHLPVPSPAPSSTAASQIHTPVCWEIPEIVVKPIPDYVGPDGVKRMCRELEESHPFSTPRKQEQVFISTRHERYIIPPFNATRFSHLACPPHPDQIDPWGYGGWSTLMHPDGSLYFHKVLQGNDGFCSIYTEAYLYSQAMLDELTLFSKYMWEHAGNIIKLGDYEVVLNVQLDTEPEKIVWSYYFIDHVRRMACWMRPYSPCDSMRTTEQLGASSPDHLQYLLRAMYWEHCALFPRDSRGVRPFPEDAYATLTSELAWCASQSVIAPIRYTAPFTTEEAVHLREQVDCLRKTKMHPEKYTEVAGGLMAILERWRYDFLHGTQVIRRFRGQTVLSPPPHSALYRVLLPVLFYAPLSHLYDCNGVYLDGILANEPEWTKHVKKLLAEWVDFVLYATILLAANLAFLSVPNAILLPDSGAGSDTVELVSPAAILSYCSTILSIGSMTIGLLLIRQHRGEEIMDNPRTDKDTFMEKRRSKTHGFEQLSMLYSLPYALLMWSILMFLAALMTFTLLATDWFTRVSTIMMLLIVVTVAVWCIRIGWGNSQNQDFFQYKREGWPLTPFDRVTARTMKGMEAARTRPRREPRASRIGWLARFLQRGNQTGNEEGVEMA
ncbi:unnamed protein product [Peniophora sp. CBMAI 1063]|nr:unnamed protein product [Peniophora sp. CBMAI 1063]